MMKTQRGSGAVIMVMMLLLMGTVLLHATRRQLSDSLSRVNDESRYIQQYVLALSALAWGERLTWEEPTEWRCQSQQRFQWRACMLSSPSGTLLRGDSGNGTLPLYRWVNYHISGKVHALPNGWIDYCPLPDREAC